MKLMVLMFLATPQVEPDPRLTLEQLQGLYAKCAPRVAADTMAAIVRVESGGNPYAIGVVGGHLERQPRTLEEAVATAAALTRGGWNFSVGLAQVNRKHLPRFGLTLQSAFEPCANLHAGASILEECYLRARGEMKGEPALGAAVSCYYSGNFVRGFLPDSPGAVSYVQRVLPGTGPRRASLPESIAAEAEHPASNSGEAQPSAPIVF